MGRKFSNRRRRRDSRKARIKARGSRSFL